MPFADHPSSTSSLLHIWSTEDLANLHQLSSAIYNLLVLCHLSSNVAGIQRLTSSFPSFDCCCFCNESAGSSNLAWLHPFSIAFHQFPFFFLSIFTLVVVLVFLLIPMIWKWCLKLAVLEIGCDRFWSNFANLDQNQMSFSTILFWCTCYLFWILFMHNLYQYSLSIL